MSNTRRTLASALTPARRPLRYSDLDVVAPREPAVAPVAPIIPRLETTHGETRIDNYHWLRNRHDPEVLAYIEAENRHTAAAMRHTEALQEQLFQEMRGRIKEADLSVPERLGQYLYYSRTEAGGQYPIFCRKHLREDGAEQVLLDQNPLADGLDYFRIGMIQVSPDHRLLAYSVDTCGAEEFTVFIKDLATGEHLGEQLHRTSHRLAWANDSQTIFYTVLDAARRPWQLYRHHLGQSQHEDELVYCERDAAFYLDISRTRSGRYLLLDLSSHSSSEVWFASADDPREPFRVIQPRECSREYSVTHHGDRFFITTNYAGQNFGLMETPVERPSREHWAPVLPYRPEVKVDSTDAFRNHLVVHERESGLTRIRILDLTTGSEHVIPFPEPVYTVRPHANPEFETTLFRFTYTSLITPSCVVDYDLAQHAWTVRKHTEVRGYEMSHYRSERLYAKAPDGVEIPISLVYRAPLELDGTRPLLLNGYGAYGLSYDPAFSSNTLTLLDRGFVVAIAHVRGGEELGRQWYEAGRRLSKRSSFTDFISVAEHLVSEGYTNSRRMVINGGSAGGLLIGAVTNLRPDLFHAVVAEVPFVDVVNTMLDASLPLTVIEYDEWGNPQDPEAYAYIRSYSPYDNVTAKDYPHMLVTAGLNDPRVAYWEPAKWTAKLRATKTDQNRLLLQVNMGAGHGGASGRYDLLREMAFKYAFILDVLGMQ
jgi:oligopeptidase B